MSSVVDVTVPLALALSLAAQAAGGEGPAVSPERRPHTVVLEASDPNPFRYTDEAWLQAFREAGPGVGLAGEAGRIFRTSGGRYYVPVAAEREQILRLRSEPGTAAVVTFIVANANAKAMAARLGRPVTVGELTAAHLLGREAALQLAERAAAAPQLSAASVLPAEALAHPALFFAGSRGRTVSEVVRLIAEATLAPRGAEGAAQVARRAVPATIAKAQLKGSLPAEKGGAGEGAMAAVRH